MNRLVINAVLKIFAKSFFLTAVIGVIIGIIGYLNKWDSQITYSNAFFLAGCLIIIAGTSSRLSAGQEWKNFQWLSGESFRKMSSGERASYIVEASSSFSTVILGLLTGIILMLIAVIAANIP